MYEVIISNVNTGRVRRRAFDSRDEADRYVEYFFSEAAVPDDRPPRSRRAHRVEVHHRAAPAVCAAPAPAGTAA